MRWTSSMMISGCLAFGCAADREEDLATGGTHANTSADSGANDGEDDGDSSTGGDEDGVDERIDLGGTDSDTGAGEDDTGPTGEVPDCTELWEGQYIPSTMYMKMKVPETAAEMFCYVNMERINYQFHGRNSGCTWGGGESDQLTWPYEMEWDDGLAQAAQSDAEAMKQGGYPAGAVESNGFDHPLYVDGCATSSYTISSPEDHYDHWPRAKDGYFPNQSAGLSNGNGTARMGVYYYDPGPNAPTLTRLGVGLAEQGDLRYWVLKFGP